MIERPHIRLFPDNWIIIEKLNCETLKVKIGSLISLDYKLLLFSNFYPYLVTYLEYWVSHHLVPPFEGPRLKGTKKENTEFSFYYLFMCFFSLLVSLFDDDLRPVRLCFYNSRKTVSEDSFHLWVLATSPMKQMRLMVSTAPGNWALHYEFLEYNRLVKLLPLHAFIKINSCPNKLLQTILLGNEKHKVFHWSFLRIKVTKTSKSSLRNGTQMHFNAADN